MNGDVMNRMNIAKDWRWNGDCGLVGRGRGGLEMTVGGDWGRWRRRRRKKERPVY